MGLDPRHTFFKLNRIRLCEFPQRDPLEGNPRRRLDPMFRRGPKKAPDLNRRPTRIMDIAYQQRIRNVVHG